MDGYQLNMWGGGVILNITCIICGDDVNQNDLTSFVLFFKESSVHKIVGK